MYTVDIGSAHGYVFIRTLVSILLMVRNIAWKVFLLTSSAASQALSTCAIRRSVVFMNMHVGSLCE